MADKVKLIVTPRRRGGIRSICVTTRARIWPLPRDIANPGAGRTSER
ncbi:MAG: hypothetical protein JXA81_00270 [Sedimentisphaerales bacterium]|nr:hypothetical protein [Sedimentisphaerales bacterium]